LELSGLTWKDTWAVVQADGRKMPTGITPKQSNTFDKETPFGIDKGV
jgi:hypothetical protein